MGMRSRMLCRMGGMGTGILLYIALGEHGWIHGINLC